MQSQDLTLSWWYLVTMQDPTGNDRFFNNGATCLFGVQGTGSGFEFCDVALVQTDYEGNAEALIPTDSKLTGNLGGPLCTSSNVPGLIPGPNLGTGPYSGITMVVKNVGVGGDSTAPNCGNSPGELQNPLSELFERNALPTFTSP